VVDVKN